MIMDVVSRFEHRVMMEAVAGDDTNKSDNSAPATIEGLKKEKVSTGTIKKYSVTQGGSFLNSFDIKNTSFASGYIYTVKGKLAGGLLGQRLQDGQWWITNLEVVQAFKDQGLEDIMVKDAVSLKLTSVKVGRSNEDMIHIYLTNGYKGYKVEGDNYLMSTKGGSLKIPDPKAGPTTPTTESFYESVDIDDGDTYLNLEYFKNGMFNFILVIGLPGSGKGSIGKTLKTKYDAMHIELDVFDQASNMSKVDIMKAGEIFSNYLFNTDTGKWYIENNSTLSINERMRANHDFILYVINYAKAHKDKKFVIDGTSIYACMDPDEIKNYPIVIKGTSAVESFRNKVKRDKGTTTEENPLHSKVTPEHIRGLLKYYFSDEQALKNFQDDLEDDEEVAL